MDRETAAGRVEFPFEDYWRLYTTFDHLYAAYARRYGESANSLYVLDTLYRHGQGISQADICADLSLPKQTVGSIMARLQRRGLVDLTTSEADGRVKLCVLTEAGWAYCEPIMGGARGGGAPLRRGDWCGASRADEGHPGRLHFPARGRACLPAERGAGGVATRRAS